MEMKVGARESQMHACLFIEAYEYSVVTHHSFHISLFPFQDLPRPPSHEKNKKGV